MTKDATRGADPSEHGNEPAPDLWAEDPANAWGSAVSWIPQQRSGEPGGTPAHAAAGEHDPWYRQPSNAEWGRPRHSATNGPPAAASPPAPALPRLPPVPPARPGPGAVSPGPNVSIGFDNWSRPEPAARRGVVREEERPPGDQFGEEPAYGPVLALTAGWYAIPAALYLVWLVTLDGDRQGFVGRQFVASLPWFFAAVVLSLAVAGLLRWAIVGWRALTLSFAAAVVGAGVTTIAHSLAL